jgi:hypothetical protein
VTTYQTYITSPWRSDLTSELGPPFSRLDLSAARHRLPLFHPRDFLFS